MFHRRRIVGADRGALVEQHVDQRERRRLAHVVGVGLEREAPDRDARPAELAAQRAFGSCRRRTRFCRSFADSTAVSTSRATPRSPRHLHERLHVLRKAGSAVAGSREQERRADARVAPDALPHEVDVGAHSSQRLAISFMNEMRVASIPLAAYFVISADGDVHEA